MTSEDPVPPKPRRGRPPRGSPGLTLVAIQAAALDLVDHEGLEGLSMRRLGALLGVDPMAVYHHLPDKAALHDTLIEAVMSGFRLPDDFEALPLAEGLRTAARAYRRAVWDHPRTLAVLMSRPFLTPGALMTVERLLGYLAAHHIPAVEATRRINALSAYVLGSLASEIPHVLDDEAHRHGGIPWETLNPAEVPHLLALAQETGGEYHHEETFEAGLGWLIQGMDPLSPPIPRPDRSR